MKGYNPKKHGNRCYNGLMSFCSELKSFVTGFQRSGNTYTSNGTAEMIKEISSRIFKPAAWSKERATCENYIKESKYDMNIGTMLLNSFWANEAIFQMQMLVYNLFLMFKQEHLSETEYWQQIKTFRLKYIFVAAKIVKTSRQKILKIPKKYKYKKYFKKK